MSRVFQLINVYVVINVETGETVEDERLILIFIIILIMIIIISKRLTAALNYMETRKLL